MLSYTVRRTLCRSVLPLIGRVKSNVATWEKPNNIEWDEIYELRKC